MPIKDDKTRKGYMHNYYRENRERLLADRKEKRRIAGSGNDKAAAREAQEDEV